MKTYLVDIQISVRVECADKTPVSSLTGPCINDSLVGTALKNHVGRCKRLGTCWACGPEGAKVLRIQEVESGHGNKSESGV